MQEPPGKRSRAAMSLRQGRLEFFPDAIPPVAAAFVLAPPEFVMFPLRPFPAIGMNREPEFGAVAIPLLGMPAIALTIANYRCRCSACTYRQHARARKKGRCHTFHMHRLLLFSCILLKRFAAGLVSADREDSKRRPVCRNLCAAGKGDCSPA